MHSVQIILFYQKAFYLLKETNSKWTVLSVYSNSFSYEYQEQLSQFTSLSFASHKKVYCKGAIALKQSSNKEEYERVVHLKHNADVDRSEKEQPISDSGA